MLQPLRVDAPLAAPTLTQNASLSQLAMTTNDTPTPAEPPRSALAKVCTVEALAVRSKAKQASGPSLYAVDLYLAKPGQPHAMLSPMWSVTTAAENAASREPDAQLAKTYPDAFQLRHDVWVVARACANGKTERCRLCRSLCQYYHDNATAPLLDRAFIGTRRKCLQVEEVLAKTVYLIFRAQRAARPNEPYLPNCEKQEQIAELVATFLEL